MTLYTLEGLSSLGPEELRTDYQTTLNCLKRCLETNDSFAAEPEPDVRIYAAHLRALPEYGARLDDNDLPIDHELLLVVTEMRGLGRRGGAVCYDLDLLHLSDEHGRLSGETETVSFRTNFKKYDLFDYDPADARRWRRILDDVSANGWFDFEEAQYWVDENYNSNLMKGARKAERRGEKRATSALAALMIDEIEVKLLGRPEEE